MNYYEVSKKSKTMQHFSIFHCDSTLRIGEITQGFRSIRNSLFLYRVLDIILWCGAFTFSFTNQIPIIFFKEKT